MVKIAITFSNKKVKQKEDVPVYGKNSAVKGDKEIQRLE
jgi:hypothetical protein